MFQKNERSLPTKMKVIRKGTGILPCKVKRVYPECRYRFLMTLKHVSTSKNVRILSRQLTTFMMSEEAKHVCLVLHPIQVQKGGAYSERRLLRQTIKIGRFSLIWIDKLSNMSKMNRLQTMRQNLLFFQNKEAPCQPNLKVHPCRHAIWK